MNKKILFILCTCLCLVSCNKEEKGQESKEVTKNVIEIDTTKKMAEKMTLDDSGGDDLVFENLSFEDKDMDQVMDFFKDYGVEFGNLTPILGILWLMQKIIFMTVENLAMIGLQKLLTKDLMFLTIG